MWNQNKQITMDIDKDFGDYILEESSNSSINLRRISWNNKDYKLDIRKWVYNDGNETALKGITLTDEGANELATALVENGYGDTDKIKKAISNRDNNNNSNSNIINDDEVYYDPSNILGAYDNE